MSPRNYFLYTPLLPSAATGTVEPRSIVDPVRSHIPDTVCAQPEIITVLPYIPYIYCCLLQPSWTDRNFVCMHGCLHAHSPGYNTIPNKRSRTSLSVLTSTKRLMQPAGNLASPHNCICAPLTRTVSVALLVYMFCMRHTDTSSQAPAFFMRCGTECLMLVCVCRATTWRRSV